MAEVILNDLAKIYPGNVKVVKNINLTIQDREFMVLFGPSGCGKAMTLRIIAGLGEISEGSVTIGGRIVNDVPPKDRDIAMVFQNYAIYTHMTVYENMAFDFNLRNFKKPTSANAQASSALETDSNAVRNSFSEDRGRDRPQDKSAYFQLRDGKRNYLNKKNNFKL
jgi:ABC-type sugar transport system ATPase subunit